jgi:hypothetical protein
VGVPEATLIKHHRSLVVPDIRTTGALVGGRNEIELFASEIVAAAVVSVDPTNFNISESGTSIAPLSTEVTAGCSLKKSTLNVYV